MPQQIKLPQWGMSMNEGTVTEWLVAPGDQVEIGQPLLEVESAKTSNSVDAMFAGVMGQILVEAGQTVPVNTVLGLILAPGETAEAPQVSACSPSEVDDQHQDRRREGSGRQTVRGGGGPGVQVVPLARKLAAENGVDLASIKGSGPRGRVTVDDVKAAIAGSGDAKPMSRMRKVIGQRMTESLQTSAQLTLVSTADVSEFTKLREGWQGGRPPSFTDAVIRACALALLKHPEVNSHIEGEKVVSSSAIGIGLAVAMPEGLVVPVVRDPDQLALAELAPVTARLAGQARDGKLTPADFEGGTFTVTSLGGQGIDAFTPILNPPEPAILGVGRVREVPQRDGDQIAWRSEMTLSLTIDHRLIDGYPGALFLAEVVALLADPTRL